LKRLHLGSFGALDISMKEQNVIWILVFCVHLRQAALSFTITLEGYNFLLEYSEIFKGLSKVKQLALSPFLIRDDSSIDRRVWIGRKWSKYLGGGNLETTAVYQFLQVTDSLDSIEIAFRGAITVSRVMSDADVTTECLSSLFNSYSSIKHLRLIDLNPTQSIKTDLSIFTNLKILSLNCFVLEGMKTGALGSSLSSAEILHLPFYRFVESTPRTDDFEDEGLLYKVLSNGFLPNLRQIVLPSRPIDANALEATSSRSVFLWEAGRKLLRDSEMVKSGKAKLRTVEVGETGE